MKSVLVRFILFVITVTWNKSVILAIILNVGIKLLNLKTPHRYMDPLNLLVYDIEFFQCSCIF